MPPVNTSRPMSWPRAAVRTACSLRRPTEQGTRWDGFPEWSAWFGVGESMMGWDLAGPLACNGTQTLAFHLGRASVFPAV